MVDNTVVPDCHVVLAPVVLDVGLVRLVLQTEEVVEENARLVNVELVDASGEGGVDVEGVESGDGVGADETVKRMTEVGGISKGERASIDLKWTHG